MELCMKRFWNRMYSQGYVHYNTPKCYCNVADMQIGKDDTKAFGNLTIIQKKSFESFYKVIDIYSVYAYNKDKNRDVLLHQ